jgi:hypothetical protein
MRAILETGYEGYVAQEFIPTWPDRALALRHASVCERVGRRVAGFGRWCLDRSFGWISLAIDSCGNPIVE